MAGVLDDPEILELARRVTIERVPVGSEWFIRVVRKRGADVSVSFTPSRGETYEPLMYDLRMKKFRTLTRDLLDDEGRERFIGMVEQLDSVEDVSQWTREVHSLLR
ncbi:MAG: MmgE/PrpD family protein [bacterium]|nr:MmgE/PrpD family protein [bacterium]